MKLFRINSVWTAIRAMFGWPSLLVGIYMVSALAGSLVPANNDWKPDPGGVDIFVETNGIHVSLIVPVSSAGEDLSDLIRPDQLNDPSLFGTHVMVGWGHGRVYQNAETWADVKSGDILSAIIGSDDTVLHVYHVTNPIPHESRKRFRVSENQYRLIIRQIRGAFRRDIDGRSNAHRAYGPDNLFYDSMGHYSALNTCNTWTGRILKNAGVRIGFWTPMPGGVMRWF